MKARFLAPLVLFGTLLTGCVGGAYYAQSAPPPPRYGVVGYAPGPGYVWTDGYWDWRGGGWVWVGGRWMRPPHPRAVWVPGGWVQQGQRQGRGRGQNRYRFQRGHWR